MEKIEKMKNYQQIVMEMTIDLNNTFPEYNHLLCKWNEKQENMEEIKNLYDYSLTIYPERFFDILYQNNDIFTKESQINTFFLPNIDFKCFFHCNDVSDNTKQMIWNYLKTILIILVNDIQDKTMFGETASANFNDIDEKELFEKLKQTMVDITGFLDKNQSNKNDDDDDENLNSNKDNESSEPNVEPTKDSTNLPNVNDFFSHIGGLLEGKVGSFAKELAEEFTKDIQGMIGEENIHDIKNPADIMKTLFKDPTKFSTLMKSVMAKFQEKMDSGEFTKEDLTKETSEIMNKMKGAGNMDYSDIMKYVSQMMKPTKSSSSTPYKNPFHTTLEKVKNKRAMQYEKELQMQKQKEEAEKNFVEYNFTLDNDTDKQPTTAFSSSSIANKKKKQKNKKK